ncbi:TadE/TadG family type IV pilus assembly protein [Chthonobacter rhizosphaerae]|uniref:TadE/TadG family type IV pilus assembly protein n=1 Tax=Chthonobacter rhizosphaerae TaxID=2735553 RepID=UPI0015EEED18|nr:TadE/TadG family type IV pilus assembly protein [Chthonobacter rhizosphaerae]
MTRLRKLATGWARRGSGLSGRFARRADGSVAVEFAIVSVPFFALLFAILETALIFFVGQILDTAVTQAARQIRTGQVQQTKLNADGFKALVCSGLAGFGDCAGNLAVEVVRYDDFNSVTLGSPVGADGKVKDDFGFDPGKRGDVVVVRGFYQWPAFFNMFGTSSTPLANGKHLLGAAVAFRNEPFPW